MIRYEHLLGRPFIFGKTDCYGLVRDFYADNYAIDLPNYARPDSFWDHGMNMYMERCRKNGFDPIDVHPSEYQIGDVFLISIRASIGNHAAILVENGQILHHFIGQVSSVVPYKSLWRNNTVAVLRHRDVKPTETAGVDNLLNYVNPSIKRKLDDFVATHNLAP